MNPRLFCRERTFHKALLLTYSFDPVFFEQVVLSDLWAGRTSDILVIGDGGQVRTAIQECVGRLQHLGKKYILGSAAHTGSFHPKVLLRLGANEGAVMIGSGNLTSCGWGANKELGCGWTFGPNHADKGAWLQPFLDDVISWCASDLEKDAVRRMKDIPWLGLQPASPLPPAPFLYSSNDRALAPALAERWRGRKFSEVYIFTGSTDERGAFLRWAHDTFGIKRAVVALTPSQASFSLEKLADLPLELRLIPMPGPTPLHAKFYYFDGPEGAGALMGSPNCSAAAWLFSPMESGNVETVLVYDAPERADFDDLLKVFESPSSKPEDVLMGVNPKLTDAATEGCPYELVGLRWDASSHRAMALISPAPGPGISVALLLGTIQVPLRSNQSGETWLGEVPGGLDFMSTPFASVRLEHGNQRWLTNIRWIDHLAELHHASQATRFLDPIKGLENSATAAEQRRILEDLQLVASELFSDSATFKDVAYISAPEVPQNSEPVLPVDPAALIRNLTAGPESHTMLGGGSAGSVSLSGILRLLFDAERSATENDPAADDENLDEGQPDSPASRQIPKKVSPDTAPDQKPVDAKLQARLSKQIEAFLENLSQPEFAQRCSANQLVQAICFPLTIAVLGQRHAWVDPASAEQWALKLVSLLLRGKTAGSPGLLGIVEQRYAANGQASLFGEVVGDGTLWMVLIATLGGGTWQGLGTFIDKAFAIRDVLRSPSLVSTAQVPRLSGLLLQLRIEDARASLSVAAPLISDLLDRLEECLHPLWEQAVLEQNKRPITHRAGELLWHPKPGWVVCLADRAAAENMEVRLRGETKKVKASFYANVTDLAKRNLQLSGLLADLNKAVLGIRAPKVKVEKAP